MFCNVCRKRNIQTPAVTDPLIDSGSALGGADQSQVQARSQAQDPVENSKKVPQRRRKICAMEGFKRYGRGTAFE